MNSFLVGEGHGESKSGYKSEIKDNNEAHE